MEERSAGATANAQAGNGLIFVLDIGTRSVTGIAGHLADGIFHVAAHANAPHPKRAMIDGQIEDIELVAQVAGTVRDSIEQQLGVHFTQVSVAAAGRALKTCRATAMMELPATVPIDMQTVYQLENAAVNEARAALDTEANDIPYYCAGHSVVRFLLDGYPFQNIIDHRAGKAEVEIIATFLPAEVVESLRHCMALLGLEIDTLTLEPIAAMRAVIPQDLRLLNLALVDIGAGTSDIALSADGTVAGFTMATLAGDEVTEAIIRKYLVDFATAETLKLSLSGNAPDTYTDILGFTHETDPADILETIAPAVDTLAHVVAEKILELNDGPPAAAFLVGGGSKVPGLCEKLTEKLNLGANKAALAGTNFSGRVLNEDSGLDGPEYATPVGIALIAAENAENEGASVTINNQRVRLFTPASTSVMDALLLGGYQYSDLMGRNGRSLTFTLNGVRSVVRGEPYAAAELTVNGKPASLSTPVESGDAIAVTPAASGRDAVATIGDYAQQQASITVVLNGTSLLAGLIARINGQVVTPDTPILEQDDVEVYLVRTVGDLCEAAGLALPASPDADSQIKVNGVLTGPQHVMNDGDNIQVPVEQAQPAAGYTSAVSSSADVPAAPAVMDSTIAAEAVPTPKETPAPPAIPSQPNATSDRDTFAKTPPTKTDSHTIPAQVSPADTVPAAPPVTNTPPAPATEAAATSGSASSPPIHSLPLREAETPVVSFKASAAHLQPMAPEPTPESELEPATIPAGRPEVSREPAPVIPSPAVVATAEAIPAPPAAVTQLKTKEPQPSHPGTAPAQRQAAAVPAALHKPASPAPQPPKDNDTLPARNSSLRIQLNGKIVVLPPKPGGEPHQLFDMLALVDIDPSNPQGMVKVLRNGADASYLDALANGDTVEIGWEEKS